MWACSITTSLALCMCFFIFYDHTYVLHANLFYTLKKDPCACQPDKIHPAAKRGGPASLSFISILCLLISHCIY